MIRQPPSNYSYQDVLNICHAGVTGNSDLRARLLADKEALEKLGATYEHLVENGLLHTIQPINPALLNPMATQNLTKDDAIKLYDYYLTDRKKPARKIYSELLAAAEDICPLCGGAGRPRNLDHFLPKSRFPQFAIFPNNLIPSCRDCNMDGKAEKFATKYEDQIIHPRLDKSIFFCEQWISAHFDGDPSNPRSKLKYYVNAPEAWPPEDRLRAENHFNCFDIAKRYSIKSSQMRRIISRQIAAFQKHGTANSVIQKCLIEPAIDELKVFPNHWLRGLHQAFTLWLSPPP